MPFWASKEIRNYETSGNSTNYKIVEFKSSWKEHVDKMGSDYISQKEKRLSQCVA
jgi:hypothetical protein